MGGGISVYAQTDVTSTYLVNPSFETLKASDGTTDVTVKTKLTSGLYGWEVADMSDYQLESQASGSVTGFPVSGDNRNITASDGTYYYFNRQGWSNKDSELKTTTKAAVAPGNYYFVFDYKAADYSNNNNAGPNGTTIGITVKDASSNTIATLPAAKLAYSKTNGDSNPGSDAYMHNAPWSKKGIAFTVTSSSVLTFAVQQNMRNSGRSDIVYDNFKLYKIDGATDVDFTGYIANPGFETANKNSWNNNGGNVRQGGYEIWHVNNAKVYQTVNGLPNGKYRISVQALHGGGESANSLLYAKVGETERTAEATEPTISSGNSAFATETGRISENASLGKISTEILVTDGSLELGFKQTTGSQWDVFSNFKLFLQELAIENYAETYVASVTADKWYVYDVAIDGDYRFISDIDNTVTYTQTGTDIASEVATSEDLIAGTKKVIALAAGKVYFKVSTDATLTIEPDTYSYSVGDGTPSVADNGYTQSNTMTVTFDDATTNDPDGALSILDDSKIKVNDVAASASIDGKVLTITLASPLATSTDYAVSIEAGAVGYNTDNTNAAISLTAKTPAVFDGTYFIATTDGTKFISRGGDSNTEATLDKYGVPVEITTDAENVSFVRFLDANLYFYAGSKSVYTDKTTAAGGDNVKWTIAAYSTGYSFHTDRDRSSETNKGNYVVAGTGAESSWEAATYGESAYAWTLVEPATHATTVAAYKDANAKTVASAAGLSATTVDALETALTSSFTSSNIDVTEAYSSPQDKYQTYGDVMAKQTLTDLKSGIYKVTLYGYQRMTWNEGTYAGYQNNAEALTAYLYANDEKIQLPSVMSEYNSSAYTAGDNPNYSPVDGKNYPNSKEAAGQAFDAGRYKVEVFALVTDGTLNIGVYSPSKYTNGNWICYRNLSVTRYVFNGDYSDLNTAITSAEANIGFEDGEYAPYNNVASMGKLATAKALYASKDAINQDAIDAVTTNLIGATWSSANAGEVNAIYDGTFAAATNDGAPAGWRSTTHDLGGATHARAYVLTSGMTNFDNLEAFGQGDTRSAFFIRFDGYYSNTGTWYNYGQTTGYEMPLKASTTYCLTLQAGAWGSYANKKLSVTIKGPSDYNQKAQLTTTKKTNDGEGVDDLSFFFTTTDAGNYTLSFWNENGANYAAIVSNIELKKAVASDIDISENDAAVPTYNFGNVTLTRTLKASYWNSFSVPFDMAIPDGWTVKEFESATDNVITLKDATTIKAGEPYLVKPATDVTNPTYNNVVVKSTEGATKGTGDYKFAAQIYNKALATDGTIAYLATDGTIKKLTSGGIKGLRAYFIIPAGSGDARISFGDETTGIRSVESQSMNNGAIYDMQGRKVTSVKKGIYVVNGKKVIK